MRKRADALDALWPSHVRVAPDHVEVGDQVARSYVVVGWPREVKPGWFEALIGFSYPLSLALLSAPVDNGEVARSMNRRMVWHRGAADAEQALGRIGRADRQVALEDADRLRLDLARGEMRMLEVGLAVTLWAEGLEELQTRARLFESLARGMLLTVRSLRYQQVHGLRRTLPLGEPPDKVREMDSRAWATLFPFSSRDVVHESGQVLGINPASQSLVIVDRFALASPHSITIGWSGAGKSFAAKLEALRTRFRGWALSIVDPEGEYRPLTQVGATLWALGDGGTGPFFPFDPFVIHDSHDADEEARQAEFLLRWLTRLAPDLMSEFRGLVQDALWRILSRPRRTFSPTLRPGLDFEELLGEVGQDNPRARERLFLARSRWTRMMGSELKESLSDDFEVFDLHRLGDGMKGPAYLALTEWLMRRLGRDNRRRLIIFDEAWHLLNDRESAPYLEELFRRARKWNTAVALLSQDIGDFTRNRAAEVCLRNAPMVLLLRQHPESVAEVTQLLRLNEGETAIIESSGMGEGLLILADDHLPLKVIASPREEQLLTAPSQIIHPM